MNSRESETGDQLLACCECGDDFLFDVSEQRFYERKGFGPPKRCKPCRDARRAQRARQTQPVDNRLTPSYDGNR
jgi:hypothetical protein